MAWRIMSQVMGGGKGLFWQIGEVAEVGPGGEGHGLAYSMRGYRPREASLSRSAIRWGVIGISMPLDAS